MYVITAGSSLAAGAEEEEDSPPPSLTRSRTISYSMRALRGVKKGEGGSRKRQEAWGGSSVRYLRGALLMAMTTQEMEEPFCRRCRRLLR